MKNTFGQSVSVTLFGESHGPEIGAVIDGLAPGIPVDEAFIAHQLTLRRPSGRISTARREADPFRVVSGVFQGRTTGAPLAILMVGRHRGNFHQQMLWLMAFTALYAVAFFIVHSHVYGMLHMACWFAVPLLYLYNGERGKCRWLGTFFYWYYPVHMLIIGIIARLLAS